jgi:predicted amidophosphoribosyltransferase
LGSTICVRCGGSLIPHSYCNACQDVLNFTCSSCSMNTDERVHAYCRNPDTVNNDLLLEKQKLMPRPIIKDDYYVNTHYIQNQLNDVIKSSSINLSTSYWNNVFESIKLINRFWNKIFNIGINNSPVSW